MIPSNRIHKLHFIGIGGAGMSGIAEVLHQNGFMVTGSDMNQSSVVEYLQKLGIHILIGHASENVRDADLVVYSSAVKMENPEIQEALKRHIPIIRRAEMLGELMRLKTTLAVAGTHGKTTTTSMLGTIFENAGLDPTVIVGGIVKGRGTGALIGQGEILIAEADEFDRSFLQMMPTSTVITNIDADHLDCYADLDEIKQAFVQYANKIPFYGQVIACLDDKGVQDILADLKKPVITYGFGRQADYRIDDLIQQETGASFSVYCRGELLGNFSIQTPGRHNVLNAAAAIALSAEEGVAPETIQQGLLRFNGVKRRFEFVGEVEGVRIYDDYAHHPTEVEATLSGARDAFPEARLIVVFQPHLYSRTLDQHDAFGAAFMHSDVLMLTDIYGARELPLEGVSSQMIYDAAERRGHRNVHCIGAPEQAALSLRHETRSGDVVIFMGAGNIWKQARAFVETMS